VPWVQDPVTQQLFDMQSPLRVQVPWPVAICCKHADPLQ
jgi:hypothetical protein